MYSMGHGRKVFRRRTGLEKKRFSWVYGVDNSTVELRE